MFLLKHKWRTTYLPCLGSDPLMTLMMELEIGKQVFDEIHLFLEG